MSAEIVHRLWVLVGVAALWWLARGLCAARRERRFRRRLGAVLVEALDTVRAAEASGARRARPGFLTPARLRRWAPVAGVVCAAWVLVGGLGGLLLGLVAGAGMEWRRVRRSGASGVVPEYGEYDGAVAARQLPLAADLLAACIAAGASPVAAAQAVGEALEGPVGERLALGAAEVRLGGEPAEAWRRLAALPGAGALARLLERAGDSGAPAALPVVRFAAEARAEWGRRATERARRAGVLITAPVGLCFLPAFLAVGVLPVVIGLAGGLLGGGGVPGGGGG
ncbi:Type II secretion system F domain-containing protein [Actinobacteria bacterium OK074]|nr:Type II secretion system F domain-containing protein [Actinobacteria bacterium OK074]